MVLYWFIIGSFILAGIAQTVWLRSRFSRKFGQPLDRGATWRGRRIFGDNKTWKGFVVMIPAVGLTFLGMRCVFSLRSPWLEQLWPHSLSIYLLLGCSAGLGYALGELPNSFIKRQLDIPPGQIARTRLGQWLNFFIDQTDSVIGALLALIPFVHIPWQTGLAVLLTGPVVHWFFNIALKLLGLKTRAG
jgi:CDP-2,3-bis-(O-geranylgeranyl)-sn-glycerol synthase